MVKSKKVLLSILFMLAICNLSYYTVWATPENLEKEHEQLDDRVKKVEKQIDKASIDNVVKAYKESESGLYEASSKAISLANYVIIGIGALTAIKYTKDNVETKKMKEFMEKSNEDFNKYKEKLENSHSLIEGLELKIKKYEEDIEKSKSEIEKLKLKTEEYADTAKRFADKSELESLRNELNVSSETTNLESISILSNISEKSDFKNYPSWRKIHSIKEDIEKYKNEFNFKLAINKYHELISLDPDDKAYYYVCIARLYNELDNLEKFEEYIEKSEKIEPESRIALSAKASVYNQNGKYELALECYKKLLEKTTDYTSRKTYNILISNVYRKLGNYEKSKEYLNQYRDILDKKSSSLAAITEE